LATPQTAWDEVIDAGIDVTASGVEQLAEITASSGARPRVQLKADTGLTRNGAYGADWDALVAAAAREQRRGRIEVTGIWSHLACADQPKSPVTSKQETAFGQAVDVARQAGLDPGLRHLA